MGRSKSLLAFILAVLMLSSIIMPDMSFADDFSSGESKHQEDSLVLQSVTDNVYASPTEIPVQIATNEPVVTLQPDMTPTPSPTLTYELGLQTDIQDETSSIMLPLEESKEEQNFIVSDGFVTKTAKIVNEVFNYRDKTVTDDKPTDETIREIKENEVLVFNEEGSTVKTSNQLISFTPTSSAVYIVTASKETLSYMYISENNSSNTLAYIRTYPKYANSIAYKLYKGKHYIISLSVNQNLPTEVMLRKYESENSEVTYKFSNNTYTTEDNASIVVDMPSLRADIAVGALEGDLAFSAELIKDGVTIDSIPEIPQDCIRGGIGEPDDNYLQFVCNFSKYVEPDKYTIRIKCNDYTSKAVIETCEAEIEIGNRVKIYVAEDGRSVEGNSALYLSNTNATTGRFLILSNGKAIGMSDYTNIYQTTVYRSFLNSNYNYINNNYNEKYFNKELYYTSVPEISFNGTIKEGGENKLKFVSGISEFEVPSKVVVTDDLIISNLYYNWSLYENTDNFVVTGNFYNLKNVDVEKINVELVDLSGKVAGTQIDYIYYSQSQIRFRLKINEAVNLNNTYSIKISYPGKIYSYDPKVSFRPYTSGNSLDIESVNVTEVENGEVIVTTRWCDKNIGYEVALYKVLNNSLYIPISNITDIKADKNGTFSLNFPQKGDLQTLSPGGSYYLTFMYNGREIDSAEFNIPSYNNFTDVDKKISFYPPILPDSGDVDFTITGYDIDNGIMGADNKNINIELVSENEVYGSLDKDTIDKSVSSYRINGNYNAGYVVIKGKLNITKTLKDETKYFIRINGTDYEYFFNSEEQKFSLDSFKIENNNSGYSSFIDSEGNSQVYYLLTISDDLKFSCNWVKGISENAKLIFVNIDTKEEVNAGVWNTAAQYHNGTIKDISITADLSKIIPNDIYEIYLNDNGQNYSLKKYVKFDPKSKASHFTVSRAVYGSDTVTLSIDKSTFIDGYSFNILDSLDNIIDCTKVSERVDKQEILIDLKLDTPLNYGFCKIQMFDDKNVIRNTTTLYISDNKSAPPSVQYVKEGYPYLVNCENLKEGLLYTADINNYDTAVRMKQNIKLVKRTDEDVLEIDQRDLESLPLGYYIISVKADGVPIGLAYFTYNGTYEIKPVITPSEWEDGTSRKPFILSNNVKFDIRTLNYTKVRYSENVEDIESLEYQTVSNDVYHTFENDNIAKILYFQFSDDYGNESDLCVFKAYLNTNKNDITIISPKEGVEFSTGINVLAEVTNDPHFVGVLVYRKGSSTIARELKRTEGTDKYSVTLSSGATVYGSSGSIEDGIEVFTTDEVGNITGSKFVKLKQTEGSTSVNPLVSLQTSIGEKKSDLLIEGNTSNGTGNVTISLYANNNNGTYNSWASYSIQLLADAKGNFKGTLNVPVDGSYRVVARDFKGTQSYNSYCTIDTVAPVLKDYNTVAQGLDSVRISWSVIEKNSCTYTIWKDGKLMTSGYRSTEYITAGLDKGQTYVFKVMATDNVGNNSEPVEISVKVGDKETPSAPQNLVVSDHASKSITLSWEPSTDNSYTSGYEIYRDGEKIGVSYTTEYLDSSLETGTEYSYKIRAFDPSMNFSDFSETISHSPKLTSISNAYDGKSSIVGFSTKKLELKALTDDILNKKGITVWFEYKGSESNYWSSITSTNTYTVTPNGLLFNANWNVEYMLAGDYTIKYRMTDRDGYSSEAFLENITILSAEDTQSPRILYINPAPSCFANTIPLSITADDNVSLKKITVQTSLDGKDWSDYIERTFSYGTKQLTNYACYVDVSKVREGDYYVRVIAEDFGGNVSNSTNTYNQYVIDRTPPAKVDGISAYSYVDCIEIKWNNNIEPYVKGFKVLRAFEPNGIYTTTVTGLKSLNYFDTTTVPGETYFYKVICEDVAGNLSPDSDPVEITMLDAESIVDNEKPEIISIYPANNTKVGRILTYVLTAKDDTRLSKMAAEYSVDGKVWKEFYSVGSTYAVDGFTAELDTALFTAGTTLKTRGYAVDIKGNTSEYKYCDYIIDNVAPITPKISVTPIARGFTITWSCEETDIETFKLYRRTTETTFYTVVGEYTKTTLSVDDNNLDPSKRYIYKIVAVDSLGNTSETLSEAVSPLDIDNIKPSPYINSVSSAEVDTVIDFDASASKDNVDITKYTWDFGDGKVGEGIRVKHSYTKPGEYIVVLKVVDSSGNEEKAEKQITILEKNFSGTLNITVKDNSGKNIPEATIYVNVGTPEQFKILTDSNGKISLKLEPGSYDIGAYQPGYSPKQQDVLIVKNEENNLSFVLEESKIIVGNITATKMSFEEIKAAGIDVNAPGNQNVFRYEINLNYNNKPYHISHIPSNNSSSGGGGSYSVGGREVAVKTYTNPRTQEVFILLIDIPGRVTWLKEFFDVKLHLINIEGTYALNNCVATLKTPAGISIAGGNDQTVSIGTIAAKESKTIEWIVRGDTPGSYNLSADFSGILETFNEQITASFVTENPIVVDNSSGLRLIVEVEDVKYPGDDLLYRVGFKNEKSSEIYMPNISMGNSTFIRSYKTKEDMSLVKTSRSVLLPGEILWEEYSADSELFEGYDNKFMPLKELASTALGGLEMPIETRKVSYGTFGRVKAQIYVMPEETKVDLITLTKYRSKENDKMPSLKIVTGRGISEDVIVHEKCELTIKDNVKNTVKTVETDSKGEYIYEGYSIDDVYAGYNGIGSFTIVISSDKTRMISSTQKVRIIDQKLLPAEDFGSISGYVFDADVNKPIKNATIKVDTYETHTGSDGGFYFQDILLTDDRIQVDADGFPKKTIDEELRDGSYVRIPMTRMPEVTRVISAVSDSNKATSSILPLNLLSTNGAVMFLVYTDLKDAGEVRKYLYKIVNKNGVTKDTGESTSSIVKVNNIRSKMSVGDRILFAIEAEGTYGIATSEYVDAKLVMAKEFPFLNAVSWQNDLETLFEEDFKYNPVSGLSGILKFTTGKGLPKVNMPADSGPIKSLGLKSAGLDFDLSVNYDFYNAKATFTTKAGAELGVDGSLAKFDVPDQVDAFLGTGIKSENEITMTLVCVYNDSTLGWEIESYEFKIASETEIKVLSFEFKYRVPLDAYFGGVLLSGYVSLKVNGTLTFKTNVTIGGLGSFDSIEDVMIELELIIGLTLRAAIGAEVAYGLLGGEFWAEGGLDFTIPTCKTVLSLTLGFKETFAWFISTEQIVFEEEWTVFDPSPRQAERSNNNSNIKTESTRSEENVMPEKKSVKRDLYAAPTTNSVASKESSFDTSPRDYLDKQKWVGGKDIIQYAYPQSEAKISELDGTNGDMIMVFIGDDSERTDNNRTALYYSIYDNGKWSEPKQLENDGTADAYPNLATDGKNSYAIWLDMPEKIGDLSKVSADYIAENIIAKMKLEIAKYDHSKGTWGKVLSPETEGLTKSPQIATGNGKTIATWVSNSGKKAVGTEDNPDNIYFVYNNGTSWTAPTAFITNSKDVNKSDLLLHNGKAYFVYTTNAYSKDGLYKLYASIFDGKTWSKPRGILDNIYNDSHPSIAVENGKPVVFWNNDGLIYKAEIESGKKEIVVNSGKTFGIQELQATNTDEGIALAWTTATGGEQKLFISTCEESTSTWTQGLEVKHNSMEIPRDLTLSGNGNEIMAVYNKSVYKYDEQNSKYYYDGTLLTSTSYVRKIDLAIPSNGIYFKDSAVMPGEQSKVYVEVDNVGDFTAKNFSVALYDGDKLVGKKEMNKSISHGNSLIAEFDYQIPANSSGVRLKGVVEVANDGDTSNNTSQLDVSYVDVEMTNVYNALYEKNRGNLYVDITNKGYVVINSAKVEVYSDKEFKNLIASKELKNLYPELTKKSIIEFEVSDQQISDRVRLYTKVVIDQPEFDYTNNSNFTIVRPYDFNFLPGTVTPEPTPVTPKPTSDKPQPTPGSGNSGSSGNGSSGSSGSGNSGSKGNGSSGAGSTGASSGGGETASSTQTTTPTPTPTPIPTPDVTEKPQTNIPGSEGNQKGYMQGYQDKTFKPENNITRAEMAVILANLDKFTKVDKEYTTFKDVSTKHWAAWAIAYVTSKGYFKGYEDNTFKPDNYITRAELSVVLCKYLELNDDNAALTDLIDIDGHWAKGYINMLSSKGYIKGYSDKTFKPNNNIKRSECAALINRALGLEGSESSENRFVDVDKNHWAFKDILIATQN